MPRNVKRTYKKTLSKPKTFTRVPKTNYRNTPKTQQPLRQQQRLTPNSPTMQRLLESIKYCELPKEEKMLYCIKNKTGHQLDVEPDRNAWLALEQQTQSQWNSLNEEPMSETI